MQSNMCFSHRVYQSATQAQKVPREITRCEYRFITSSRHLINLALRILWNGNAVEKNCISVSKTQFKSSERVSERVYISF